MRAKGRAVQKRGECVSCQHEGIKHTLSWLISAAGHAFMRTQGAPSWTLQMLRGVRVQTALFFLRGTCSTFMFLSALQFLCGLGIQLSNRDTFLGLVGIRDVIFHLKVFRTLPWYPGRL